MHRSKISIDKIALKVRDLCSYPLQNKETGECFEKDLGGACAICSFTLHHVLKKFKVKTNVIQGIFEINRDYDFYKGSDWSNHCWLEYKNLIIDITATQFGIRNRVLIFEKLNRNRAEICLKDNLYIYKRCKVANKIEDFSKWSKTERPSLEFSNKILEKI